MYSLLQWLSLSSGSRKISEVCVKRPSLLGGVLALFPVSTVEIKGWQWRPGMRLCRCPILVLFQTRYGTLVCCLLPVLPGAIPSLIPRLQVSFPKSKSHSQNPSLIPKIQVSFPDFHTLRTKEYLVIPVNFLITNSIFYFFLIIISSRFLL